MERRIARALAGGPMTNELEGKSHESSWKLLLRRGRAGGLRIAGGHGLLPLRLLSLVVRWTRQRLQPLEAGGRSGHLGRRARGDLSEDRAQPAPILRQVRRTPDDQSSA